MLASAGRFSVCQDWVGEETPWDARAGGRFNHLVSPCYKKCQPFWTQAPSGICPVP